MKFLLFSLFLSLACASNGQVGVNLKLQAINKRFQKLDLKQRTDYTELKKIAYNALQREKFFSCLVAIQDAQTIFDEDLDIIWLNGICLAQIHDVDGAIRHYNRVLTIDPAHFPTLMDMVEINFFAGRYEKTIFWITRLNKLLDAQANKQRLPLLDIKHLICLTKLAKTEGKAGAEWAKKRDKAMLLYEYEDDTPFYYYAQALKALDNDNKQEGLIWILKAYLIFAKPELIETWNKALVDTGYIGAHEIMFIRKEE